MALKKSLKKPTLAPSPDDVTKQVSAFDAEIKDLESKVSAHVQTINDLRRRRADLVLSSKTGFHIGDTVMYLVPSGRTKKLTKCVIEFEDRQIFVRPMKDDGTLSTRHFYVFEGNYSDLKAVE